MGIAYTVCLYIVQQGKVFKFKPAGIHFGVQKFCLIYTTQLQFDLPKIKLINLVMQQIRSDINTCDDSKNEKV